tara:strand:- start:1279 stop:2121 length:843 start_codon:yes stop_codon:yes gene_type:complete
MVGLLEILVFGVLGGFIFDKFDKNKSDQYGDSEGNIKEAQAIPLSYISGATTSVLDPEVLNPFRQQLVGTNSYLTMVQTSSYEFMNIQPDNIVPPRFKDPKNPPSSYFFTVPNNNNKLYTWNVPEWYYVLKVMPQTSGKDNIKVLGNSEDFNKAAKILQDEMTKIVSDYNKKVADRDAVGGSNNGEPLDDVENQGEGSGLSEGFGVSMAAPQEAKEDKKFEPHYMYGKNGEEIFVESYEEHLSLDSKGFVHEKPAKKIVKDNGNVIGSKVNMGGSPYAGL